MDIFFAGAKFRTLTRKAASAILPLRSFPPPRGERSFDEAPLDPTPVYAPFVKRCVEWGADIHYAVNVTGRGWRKLMRAPPPFAYVTDTIPTPQPVFDFIQQKGLFIQQKGLIDDRETCGNYGMGAGFALYVPESDMKKLWDMFYRFDGWSFGIVWTGCVAASDEKRAVIKPKDIAFTADELKVRYARTTRPRHATGFSCLTKFQQGRNF